MRGTEKRHQCRRLWRQQVLAPAGACMESKNLPPSSSAAGLLCNIMIVWRRQRSRAEHSEKARRNASSTLTVSGPSAGAA
jgi:hypothetical protein